ncbi:MAG: hypothetical protein HQ565_03135 [Bacteroidetes bacterium]|nr:hypothetical protein [Bacteroidota bacterium]
MSSKRKIIWQLRIVIIIMMLNVACKKDNEVIVPPSIMIMNEQGYISSDTSIAPGSEIRLKVMMQKGDLNITNFLIDVYTDEMQHYFDTGMNVSYLEWQGIFIKTSAAIEEWKFIVRDRDGNSSSTSLMISLDTSGSYQPLQYYSPVLLGAQDNEQEGGCFNISDSSMHFHVQVAEDTALQSGIDLIYYYSPEDENTIASPGANIEDDIFTVNPANWTIKNTSRYIKISITPQEFLESMNDSIIIANYDEGEAKRKAKKLKKDDIYTFRTQDGRLGMFLVNEVSGTTDGSINISLKTQP